MQLYSAQNQINVALRILIETLISLHFKPDLLTGQAFLSTKRATHEQPLCKVYLIQVLLQRWRSD